MERYFPFRAYLHFLFDNFRICPHTLITWFVNTYDYKWAEIIGYFTNFYKPQMGYRSYLKVGLIFFLILNSFIIFNIIQFEAIPTLM